MNREKVFTCSANPKDTMCVSEDGGGLSFQISDGEAICMTQHDAWELVRFILPYLEPDNSAGGF